MRQELTNRLQRMNAALEASFSPQSLVVTDESHRHAGHAGASPEGETHYRIEMRAESLRGLSRVEQHRRVNAALQGEFDTGLHALTLDLGAP